MADYRNICPYAFISLDWNDWETGEPYYLAWQPNTYDDGYFWTQKAIFMELVGTECNQSPHRFTFKTRESAKKIARELKLKKYKIVKWC